jgi:hypothetical protein
MILDKYLPFDFSGIKLFKACSFKTVILNLLVMRDHLTKFLSCHISPTVWR